MKRRAGASPFVLLALASCGRVSFDTRWIGRDRHAIGLEGALSSTDEDADPWLSPDGHTMYMARDTGSGLQIYMGTR